MIKLWWVLFATVVVLGMLIYAAHLIGAANASPFAALFVSPDGSACTSPCLFGIRAGETSLETASATLASHPLFRGFRKVSTTPLMLSDTGDGDSVLLVLPTANGFVKSITWSPGTSPEKVGLGDIITELGPPDIVVRGNDVQYFAYINRGVVVSTAADNPRQIGAGTPVRAIELMDLPDCELGGSVESFPPWFGFGAGLNYCTRTLIRTNAVKLVGLESTRGLELCRPAASPSALASATSQRP